MPGERQLGEDIHNEIGAALLRAMAYVGKERTDSDDSQTKVGVFDYDGNLHFKVERWSTHNSADEYAVLVRRPFATASGQTWESAT